MRDCAIARPGTWTSGSICPVSSRWYQSYWRVQAQGKWKIEFIKEDVSELAEVYRACKEMQQKENSINLIFQTQGNMNTPPRPKANAKVLGLHALILESSPPAPECECHHTTGGAYGTIDMNDIELKHSYTGLKNAARTIIMNDFMAEQHATREPAITFIHTRHCLSCRG
ncbi:hypothetical protein LZ554_002099 [Drepanopeziza brunnea f. sp. 'monogermtubi']|nr:hypothetical protein LZ554_002099 [Drepanopeziza brunnea f. sp. 'monogermtubi']